MWLKPGESIWRSVGIEVAQASFSWDDGNLWGLSIIQAGSHVDALTAVVPVVRVMISSTGTECLLVRRDLESGRWAVVAAGFGSSDCRRHCPAHLLAGSIT